MATGRHAHATSHRTSAGSRLGNVSYIGIIFLLIGGGVIVGSGFVIAYLGARIYFGLSLAW
ncbi:hypothetical protein [Amycolatopsis sp. cmx-11-12]|uniref:hypothetical protein n=1 Tax=Amycolatopsis sp. cmx-11-12 TaxID=2785795 RepID=UPI00391861EE